MAQSITLLLARLAIGVTFLIHGWMKFTTMGISGVTAFFEQIGVPLPGLAAPVVAALEVVGGIALIVGAALPVFGILLALDMVGAIVFVHLPNGFLADKGGIELPLVLGAACLALAFTGGGALAADGLWQRRKQTAAA
ncbi:DoxX family protein [Nonomuraea sp. NPDC059194]|uniref:DoxX family protein n=1 Tax=Nonomuraea sp. NPDC059194 TaxID=3346764 RepID=UPI00369BFD2E